MGGGGSKKQQAADVDSGAMTSVLRGDSSDTAAPTNIGEKQQTNKETNDRIVNNNKDNNVNDNAISSTNSTPPSAVDSSNTSKDSTDTLARAKKAEEGVLPVPEEALRWVEGSGDAQTKANDEKKNKSMFEMVTKGTGQRTSQSEH